MIWKLWTNKKIEIVDQIQELVRPINQHLTHLNQQVKLINQQVTPLNQQVTGSLEQITELSDQIRKLGRLQYKSGQDVQGKLEGLSSGLDAVQQWQHAQTIDKSYLANLEQQIGQVCELLLVWLDDLDLLATSIRNQKQEGWLKLLRTWTIQVLQALQIHGISEMQLVGTSFDPALAESIGTVVRQSIRTDDLKEETDNSFKPYEIAEVVKRGFIYQDGSLLRKAHVITYQEDDHEK